MHVAIFFGSAAFSSPRSGLPACALTVGGMSHRQGTVPSREAKLFRNNKSQAVRIAADFELPGDGVMIYRDDRITIEPVHRKKLQDVLAGCDVLCPEDDVDESLLPAKAIDL
ncbi:AbrB family transcriptional regulator (plasmid) [Rhizobium leguminosarum bv. trifolii CB782]|nr:AbrB family transcriptional regulator [Rhizobium leguminosarum bv. trifolii CB782]